MKKLALLVFMVLVARGAYASSPEEVVNQFCQLDFSGARLSSTTADSIRALTVDGGLPPAYPVILIQNWQVIRSTNVNTGADVTVSYHSVGVIRQSDLGLPGFFRSDQQGLYIFHLANASGDWKIQLDALQLGPHVSVTVYRQHLKEQAHAMTLNSSERRSVNRLIKQLKLLESATPA